MAKRTELLRYMRKNIVRHIGKWILIEEINPFGEEFQFVIIGKVKEITFENIKFDRVVFITNGMYERDRIDMKSGVAEYSSTEYDSIVKNDTLPFGTLRDTKFKWLKEEDVEKEIVARSL